MVRGARGVEGWRGETAAPAAAGPRHRRGRLQLLVVGSRGLVLGGDGGAGQGAGAVLAQGALAVGEGGDGRGRGV